MGLDLSSATFLRHCQRQGVSFRRTLTLGRQRFYINREDILSYSKELGAVSEDSGNGFADSFFQALGAEQLDIMDASDYEGASVVHDLNNPVSNDLHSRYDCVFDGGTLEHVFNFPNAIKSCLEMVRPGGHFIGVTPGDQMLGHGFYQFSPELFYRIFANNNGFELEEMLIVEKGRWFSVPDPEVLKHRVEFVSAGPLLLFIRAKRLIETAPFVRWPQQSDYEVAWTAHTHFRKEGRVSIGFRHKILRQLEESSGALRWIYRAYQRNKDKRERAALKARVLKPVSLSI